MDVDGEEGPVSFLDTVEGELSLFRSIARTRPVGTHKHWHMFCVLCTIKHETGRTVSADETWKKLDTVYNLEGLENLADEDSELSPLANPNLQTDPFFDEEFTLPHDQFESLIAPRRLQDRPSATPPPSRGGSSRNRTKDIGAFDSEGDLTEPEEGGAETGAEAAAPDSPQPPPPPPAQHQRRPSRSRSTRSDAASLAGEDVDMAGQDDESSPAPSAAGTKSTRRRASTNASASNAQIKKKPPQTRARNATATAAAASAAKKRKK